MSNYQLWQLERFGNIIVENGVEELENGTERAERVSEMLHEHEQRILDNN